MKQVLLLDDNPSQLSIRELVLRKGGLESHIATNAHSALALLRSDPGQQKIGAVVTDHVMPGMD
ncbi:MAG: response regulator, partial [Candidatus Angelobacter sp.]